MRTSSILFFLLITVFAVHGYSEMSGDIYTDTSGLTIKKPSDWRFDEKFDPLPEEKKDGGLSEPKTTFLVLFSKKIGLSVPVNPSARLAIYREKSDKEPLLLLEKLVKTQTDEDKDVVVNLAPESQTISGQPAAKTEYVVTDSKNGRSVRVLRIQWLFKVGRTIYMLHMSCLESDAKSWRDIFNEIAASIKI